MNALRTFAAAAALLVSAPALAAPSTSSISFVGGILFDSSGAIPTMAEIAAEVGFTPHDPVNAAPLGALSPLTSAAFLSISGYALNVPDPNVPVTLSLSVDLFVQGFYAAGGPTTPFQSHITQLPPSLDLFQGAPPVVLNDLSDALFGVTFPNAAALEAEILETIGELAALIPPVAFDPAIGGFMTGDFDGTVLAATPIVGPGFIGGLTIDALPLLVDLNDGLGGILPFDPNTLESALLLLEGTVSLTATPVLGAPPTGPSEVPVPAPLAMLGAGMLVLARLARRRRT